MLISKYFKIWLIMTFYTAQVALQSRFGAVMFIIGKLLRFSFFLFFLFILGFKTNVIAGYSLWQMIFFFATFNLIDTLAQFFLREVYRFRTYVINGFLDFILTKPFPPLLRSLFGGSDILDVPLIFISIVFVIIAASNIGQITIFGILLYALLIFNAFFIALAFHIFVLSVGVLTTEVDNTLFLYRDLTQMARIPVDIYQEPLRGFITFIIPVGVMITFPAKALMGLLSLEAVMISFMLGILLFFLSIWFWKFSLKNYASVSS